MAVFPPLAYLAAVFAIAAAFNWWSVASTARHHCADAARVNRKLYLAAVGTMFTLGLAAASIVAVPLASLFV